MTYLFAGLLFFASASNASSIHTLNFDFVAPVVPSLAYAPNQVGLIVYDSTNKMFFGRTTADAPYQWIAFGGDDVSHLSKNVVPAVDGGINLGSETNRIGSLFIKDSIRATGFADSFINFYPEDGGVVMQASNHLALVAAGQTANLLTVHRSQPRNVNVISNDSDHGWGPYGSNADSGVVTVATGRTFGTGNSGQLILSTGDSDSVSGNVEISTGVAGGTRGSVNVSAAFLRMPTGSSDPAGVEGAMYFNVSTHKLRLFDGTSWVNLN